MAQVDFILQAVTAANHADAIVELVGLPEANRVLISVAYMREAGLAAVEAAIQPLALHTEVFVGIRNDLTSVQAVKRLLAMDVRLYAVDTASRQTIYHPKLYLVSSETNARVIIGSANLTFGGMHNNIEVSGVVSLDLADVSDARFVNQITVAFADIINHHPDHVFLVRDATHADLLFEAGRLADEEIIPAPSTGSSVKSGSRDNLRPMRLNLMPRPRARIAATRSVIPMAVPAVAVRGRAVLRGRVPSSVPRLVWQSRGLTERDLNIPRAGGTNPTGSMGWKKGAFDNIDQRHYFRDEVFDGLQWIADRPPSPYERAWAKFEFIIKNLNYGVITLKLSHNTSTRSRSYLQNNFMTQVHWGEAKGYIAKRDLLGRTLYLYRKDTNPPEFVIEID